MPETSIEVAAYYFPQFHPDPRNDAWHGEGWTEWEVLKAARPRFPGHRQPITPAWGHFNESDPAWAAREIDLAADHGITSFIFDWYWYEDGPFLQAALEQGFLAAPNNHRLRFGLMWANYHWLDYFPASAAEGPRPLLSGHVSRDAFDRLADYLLATFMHHPSYLTVDGQPYFSIYDVGSFIAGLGGLDAAREALDSFRDKVGAAGFPGLHVNAIGSEHTVISEGIPPTDLADLVQQVGFSSVATYAWAHHFDPRQEERFPRASYAAAAERNFAVWDTALRRYSVPYHPNVTMGWDPSPRCAQDEHFEPHGYPWMAVLDGNTPEAFEHALRRVRAFVERPDVTQKLLTLNAWNEWTEGSYLLPDTDHGTAYIEAIARVFGQPDRPA